MKIEERDEQIKNLYLSENISLREIGNRYNLSSGQIGRILLKQGFRCKDIRKERFNRWADEAKALIKVDPTITNSQIAEKLNIPLNTVRVLLRKSDLRRDQALIQPHIKKVWRRREQAGLTKDLLFQLYVIEEKSASEIGKLFNYTGAAIGYNLKKHGIEIRSQSSYARKKV